MYVFCVRAKHMSEDVAFKRIRAARAARRYPVILREIAQGRLHLTGVALLSKYLKPGNARELLAAAVHKSRGRNREAAGRTIPAAGSAVPDHAAADARID